MANTPEYDCVRKLLCPLGEPVIKAVKKLIQAIIIQLELQLLAIEAALAPLDVASKTAEAAFKLAQAVIQEILTYADYIPPIPPSCGIGGKTGLDLRERVEDLADDANELKRKWVRKLSLYQFYADERDAIMEAKEDFQDWVNELNCEELTS